jgi:hypothetical protein
MNQSHRGSSRRHPKGAPPPAARTLIELCRSSVQAAPNPKHKHRTQQTRYIDTVSSRRVGGRETETTRACASRTTCALTPLLSPSRQTDTRTDTVTRSPNLALFTVTLPPGDLSPGRPRPSGPPRGSMGHPRLPGTLPVPVPSPSCSQICSLPLSRFTVLIKAFRTVHLSLPKATVQYSKATTRRFGNDKV